MLTTGVGLLPKLGTNRKVIAIAKPTLVFLLMAFSLSSGAVLINASIRTNGQKYCPSHKASWEVSNEIIARVSR